MIMYRSKNGITLVALVVTIVILLILAGITIASLTGENGLIGKSGEAKNATEKSQEKEELEVAVIRFTDKRGNLDATKIVNGLQNDIKNLKEVTNTDGKFPVKVEYKNGHKYGVTEEGNIIENLIGAGDKAPDDSNAAYISGSNIAVIPAGFTVSSIQGETSIEDGLVVIDNSQNEWVWIPVDSNDLDLMYTENNTGWTLCGTGGETQREAIVTKYKSNSRTDVRSDLLRENPGNTSGFREPDMVIGDNSNYDCIEENYKAAGFDSYEQMSRSLKDDYKNMIDSVKKNKGFYLGRYEISNDGTKKNKQPLKNTTWYNLYKKCKELGNTSIESRMIWSCQWEQICKFIKIYKEGNEIKTRDFTNSSSYGNYSGTLINTGTNDNYKTKNIYDLAGNCWEFTQETYNNNNRSLRGAGFTSDPRLKPVTFRGNGELTNTWHSQVYGYSSRPTLYLN